MQPNSPIARSGDLVVFEVHKLERGHIFRNDIGPLSFQHRREDDAVENDVIFSDEMD